jgi:hypothetical protein
MYQIDNSTAAATIPASTAAGTPGFFTDGNPATGVAATIMPAEYQNMLMMEIINVLAAAGVTPSKSNFTQLLTAIRAVGRQGTILTDTGVAGTYAAANTPALAALPASGYIQRINIANVNTGASTYAPDGLAAKPIYGLGLQPLQGGELPAGVAVLMYLVQAGVNGGNGAWIVIESLGGASQVAAATKTLHALQLGQGQSMFSSPIGTATNLKMTVATVSATATVTADEIIVGAALGGQTYRIASFNAPINLASTGAGAMDTGAAPVNGWVAIYAIYNPLTNAKATLGVASPNSVMPAVYGGANMPAGYTASALLTVVATNASGQFKLVHVTGRDVFTQLAILYNGSAVVSNNPISIANFVPANAKIIIAGELSVGSTLTSFLSLTVSPDVSFVGQQNVSITLGGGQSFTLNYSNLPIISPQIVMFTSNNSAGTPTYYFYASGYRI